MEVQGAFLKIPSTQLFIRDKLIIGYSKLECLAPISHCPVKVAVE